MPGIYTYVPHPFAHIHDLTFYHAHTTTFGCYVAGFACPFALRFFVYTFTFYTRPPFPTVTTTPRSRGYGSACFSRTRHVFATHHHGYHTGCLPVGLATFYRLVGSLRFPRCWLLLIYVYIVHSHPASVTPPALRLFLGSGYHTRSRSFGHGYALLRYRLLTGSAVTCYTDHIYFTPRTHLDENVQVAFTTFTFCTTPYLIYRFTHTHTYTCTHVGVRRLGLLRYSRYGYVEPLPAPFGLCLPTHRDYSITCSARLVDFRYPLPTIPRIRCCYIPILLPVAACTALRLRYRSSCCCCLTHARTILES